MGTYNVKSDPQQVSTTKSVSSAVKKSALNAKTGHFMPRTTRHGERTAKKGSIKVTKNGEFQLLSKTKQSIEIVGPIKTEDVQKPSGRNSDELYFQSKTEIEKFQVTPKNKGVIRRTTFTENRIEFNG